MIALAIVALALSAAPPAGAQPVPAPGEATPIDIQRMCRPEGAIGFTFGQTGVPYGSRLERSMGLGWGLPAAMRPFTKAQALATPWSGRLAQIEYEAVETDQERGEMALLTLAAAAEAAGWVRNEELEDPANLPMYLMPVAGDHVYNLPGSPDVIASISYGLGKVTVVCAHKALLRANAEEALGKLPAGTPRPEAPEVGKAVAYTAADCGRAEAQDAMLTILDGEANGLMARLLTAVNHAERLAQWKSWRLESSGKFSKEQLLKLTMTALDQGSPGGDPLAGFALFPRMLDVLETLAEQAEAGDRAAACATSFELLDVFRQMEAISSRQWRAMDRLIEAEAKRVGVSLD